MPKTPILSRKVFIAPVRGPGPNLVFRHFDWNVVETELGPMVEALAAGGIDGMSKVTQLDMTDAGFNALEVIDEGDFSRRFEHGGVSVLRDYNA